MPKEAKENTPDIWLEAFPRPKNSTNKYGRGHAAILGAPELTGATRLASSACSRIGAGLVTVLSDVSKQIYQMTLPPDIMVRDCSLRALAHVTATLGGPGGITDEDRQVLLDYGPEMSRVLDAAILTDELRGLKFGSNTVVTPHDGEFKMLFGHLPESRISQCLQAARMADCVVLRKGPKTIIAHPDGRIVMNDAPNPYLAKAGTGDVLAGFVTGLLAQAMPAFEACCAAVWIHSDAGDRLGPGLTACDLEYTLPEILREVAIG